MSSPRRYGWRPPVPDHRDVIFGLAAPATYPDAFRITDGMPPVYDQLETNSCTANASAALFEYELYKQHLPGFMPSRLFAYYNERLIEGDPQTDGGASVRDALKSLAQYGTVPETQWPFSEPVTQSPTASLYPAALANRVTNYAAVPQALGSLCTAIASLHPVEIGIAVYESFESDVVAVTGRVELPGPDETMLGGHAVVLVGYDSRVQRFTVRNSWGPDWGQNGYFTIPFSYVLDPQLASDFWIINTET